MSVSLSEIAKAVALTELPGIADGRAKELIDELGSPDAVHSASFETLSEYHYIDEETYDQLEALDSVVWNLVDQFQSYRDEGIELIPTFDNRYPRRLRAVSGPLLLYARGDVDLLAVRDAVGFTGTRDASEEATTWTRETASTLAAENKVVISGGATGVDTAAHLGALDASGQTIAVFGTGLNVPYPEGNASLFERIVDEGGLLLSQFPPDAGPSRAGFLNRNETLTGLSQSVLVVATDGSGGTMSTYSDAKSQGRKIFCPDPELGLEPVDGIRQIANEKATPVCQPEEILTYQDNSGDGVDEEIEADSSKSDGQSSISDFG